MWVIAHVGLWLNEKANGCLWRGCLSGEWASFRLTRVALLETLKAQPLFPLYWMLGRQASTFLWVWCWWSVHICLSIPIDTSLVQAASVSGTTA